MHVGVDARLIYHQPAGISRYTWHLLQAIADLTDDDEFVVFQHRKHRTTLIIKPNFRRATLFSPVHTRLEQILLPVELLRFPLELLHSTDFIPPLYSSVPTVITVHDLAFLHWPHFLTADSAAYYGQIDRAVHHAKHIIVPSESTKKDLVGQLGVPKAKVSVISEAADSRFAPLPKESTRREICAKYDLPPNFVLFVGTIEPRKNVNGLLQAFKHLVDTYKSLDVGLAIAGSPGWLYQETLELVDTLGLEQRTHFLGRVPDDDLNKLYVAAQCHVHPAHYEGFGLPPLEAMACGTPTIVSNVSSLPEVVGDAAILVDPENWEELAIAMNRVLTDKELHEELSEKGLQRAACFSWKMAAQRTLDVYRQIVTSQSPAPAASPRAESSRQTNRIS